MALDAAHRAPIDEKLRPVLGDDDANALMSEFPASEAREIVTKDFLRAELAGVRTEMAEMTSALTVRMGSAIAASTALLAAVGVLT